MDRKKLLALSLVMGLGTGCLEGLEKGMDTNVPPKAEVTVIIPDGGVVEDESITLNGEEVTVTLDGSGSSDPDGEVVEYFWKGFDVSGSEGVDVLDGGTLDGGSATGNLKDAELIDDTDAEIIDDAEVEAEEGLVIDSGVDGDDGEKLPASATPDPDDKARPKVKLGKGTHAFVLWVTDNNGAVSVPDTVVITVE